MNTAQDPKTRSGIGQCNPSARLAKTHEDYWKQRLRRRSYRTNDGTAVEVPEWQVKLFRDGRQSWINLETANRDAAARKARDLWLKLRVNGWDAVKPQRVKHINPTFGEYLAAVKATSDLRPVTFEIYASKLRTLVAAAIGLHYGRDRHDHAQGGHLKWRARVEAVRLGRLSPAVIQRWKTRYLARFSDNPLHEKRARRSVACGLRNAKSLFSKRIVKKLDIELPDPLPFADIDIPRASTSRYLSKIDPTLLYLQAQRELESPTEEMITTAVDTAPRCPPGPRKTNQKKQFRPEIKAKIRAAAIVRERVQRAEAFKVFCLALFAGLRRDEIDTLTWKQVDFVNHTIRVETNEYTSAKTEGSEAAVDIDVSLAERLKAWKQASTSEFVIESPVRPRPKATNYHHYRTYHVTRKLLGWLRTHGVEAQNALHTLRKEFGTQINRTYGIFAASMALRHSSIQLTQAIYVAKKDRAVFPLPDAQPPAAVKLSA